MSDTTDADVAGEGAAAAESPRLVVRTAGYCVLCDRIVERVGDGGCDKGHPAEAVTGRIILSDGEPVPQLPRFNLAAFLLPPIWGPAHGLWVGAIFLPLWLFADSILRATGEGAIAVGGSLFVVVATGAMMAWFAKRANGLAWRRMSDQVSVAEYARRERRWALASVPVAALLLGMALYYDLIVLPARSI